jgi:hypothetical protein
MFPEFDSWSKVKVLIMSALIPTQMRKIKIAITKKIPPEFNLIYVDFSLKFKTTIRRPIKIKGVYRAEKSSQQSSQELIWLPVNQIESPLRILKNDEFISTLKAIVAPISTEQDITRVIF